MKFCLFRIQTNSELFNVETGLFHADLDPYTEGVQNNLFDALRRDERLPSKVKEQRGSHGRSSSQTWALAAI